MKLSHHVSTLVKDAKAKEFSADSFSMPPVFFIGAMAHGSDDFESVAEQISISQYPLSASVACGKLCCAFEDLLNII